MNDSGNRDDVVREPRLPFGSYLAEQRDDDQPRRKMPHDKAIEFAADALLEAQTLKADMLFMKYKSDAAIGELEAAWKLFQKWEISGDEVTGDDELVRSLARFIRQALNKLKETP